MYSYTCGDNVFKNSNFGETFNSFRNILQNPHKVRGSGGGEANQD